jgi:hypothetical protein
MYSIPLKKIAANWTRLTILPAILILTTSCSIFGGGTAPITVSSKPVEIRIIQPSMPRGIDLNDIKWNVISTAKIANPCVKNAEGSENPGKREKLEDGSCANGKEHPEWTEDYTYLDRFLETNKKDNNGDIVFMAISIGDYEVMSGNMQELRRYIREVQEVVVYYRNVTINDKPAVGAKVRIKD